MVFLRAISCGTDKVLSQVVVEAGKVEELAGYISHALIQLAGEVGATLAATISDNNSSENVDCADDSAVCDCADDDEDCEHGYDGAESAADEVDAAVRAVIESVEDAFFPPQAAPHSRRGAALRRSERVRREKDMQRTLAAVAAAAAAAASSGSNGDDANGEDMETAGNAVARGRVAALNINDSSDSDDDDSDSEDDSECDDETVNDCSNNTDDDSGLLSLPAPTNTTSNTAIAPAFSASNASSRALARGRSRARLLLSAAASCPCSDWKAPVEQVFLEVRAGRTDRARALVRAAIARFPGTGRLWALRVALAQEQGFEEQSRMFQLAVGETPKSGEVWCEGAKIALNPTFPSFSLKTAAEFLRFAVHFTPQYGDSFVELIRVKMLSFGPFQDHESMQRLRSLCINTDPNYGLQWNLHRSHAPLMAVSETFAAVCRHVASDLLRYRCLYQRAVTQGFASPALYRQILAGTGAGAPVPAPYKALRYNTDAGASPAHGASRKRSASGFDNADDASNDAKRAFVSPSPSRKAVGFALASPRRAAAAAAARCSGVSFESVLASPVAAATARALVQQARAGAELTFTPPHYTNSHAHTQAGSHVAHAPAVAATSGHANVCDAAMMQTPRKLSPRSSRIAVVVATPASKTSANSLESNSPSVVRCGSDADSEAAVADPNGSETSDATASNGSGAGMDLTQLKTLWSPRKPRGSPGSEGTAADSDAAATTEPGTGSECECDGGGDAFDIATGSSNSVASTPSTSYYNSNVSANTSGYGADCGDDGLTAPVAFGGFDDAEDDVDGTAEATGNSKASECVAETEAMFATLSIAPTATLVSNKRRGSALRMSADADAELDVTLPTRASTAGCALIAITAAAGAAASAAASCAAATDAAAADAATELLFAAGAALATGSNSSVFVNNGADSNADTDDGADDDDSEIEDVTVSTSRTVVTRDSLRGEHGREFASLFAERRDWQRWSLASAARLRTPLLALPLLTDRILHVSAHAGAGECEEEGLRADERPVLLLAAGARMAVEDLYAQLFSMD